MSRNLIPPVEITNVAFPFETAIMSQAILRAHWYNINTNGNSKLFEFFVTIAELILKSSLKGSI